MATTSWICAVFVVTLTALRLVVSYPMMPSKTNVLWFEVSHSNRNCRDVQRQGYNTSGIYTIFPYDCCPNHFLEVYCDMETDGGGWTVIQRRDDITPREDFYRTWIEYALGFGNLKGEFWLGLDHIHALTDQALNEVRFDMEDFDHDIRWAKYKLFYVHDRNNFYKLEVNGYTGNAGDGLTNHNEMLFSTKDKDHDSTDTENCATTYKAAWWYNRCHHSSPNGEYLGGVNTWYGQGISWTFFRGLYYSLKKIDMKIRPFYTVEKSYI